MSRLSLALPLTLVVSLAAPRAHAGAGSCRERASSLREAAAGCRSDVAAGRLSSCSVSLEFRGDVAISSSAADALATDFAARAGRFDAAEAQVSGAHERVKADEAAIRALGFRARVDAFEDYGRLPGQVKARIERDTISAIADVALQGIAVGVTRAGSLNPWTAQRLIGRLKALGFENRALFDAIRIVAKTRGKPAQAKALREVIVLVGRGKDVVEHGSPENVEQFANGVAAVLAWGIDNPAISARLAIYKWIAARAYDAAEGVVAVKEVEGLTALTEGDLGRLKDLDAALHADVESLTSARASLAQISDCR